MTILVTGGAGFIGTNFIIDWFKNGKTEHIINLDLCEVPIENVRNLDFIEQETAIGSCSFIRGDVGDRSLIRSILEKYAPRIVVNLAAKTGNALVDNPHAFVQTNVNSQSIFLEEVRSWWSKCHEKFKHDFKFIHVSTIGVYGSAPIGGPVSQTWSAASPMNPEDGSKAAMDMILCSYIRTYKFPVILVRASNIFGKYQFENAFIPGIISSLLTRQQVLVQGDGVLSFRQWLHVSDFCNALRLLISNGHTGAIYNVGAKDAMSHKQMVDLILDLHFEKYGQDMKDSVKYDSDVPYDSCHVTDSNRIRKDVNWEPKVDLNVALREAFEWYTKQY